VIRRLSDSLGSFVDEIGSYSIFARALISSTFRFARDWKKEFRFDVPVFFQQMEGIGVNSLLVVLITALFTGMVLALQASDSLEHVLKGISQFIGRTVALPFVKELAPVLTALIVTGRVGSAMAAEIGTMQVTEQIDALKTMGVNPIRYLGVPRLAACLVMLPLLTAIATVVGILGGFVVARFTLGISGYTYFTDIPQMMGVWDVVKGLGKSPFFGAIIAITSCYQGFLTTGGAEGVGRSTTRAVVISSMLILISDYFLTAIFVLLF
jgi:phospholipid/cholesterol/gamma-HCH transport system permease protein